MECRACPFDCGVDRSAARGVCRAPEEFVISLAQLHHWEEPPISGGRGSGTIFFSHCNLRCRFCQNHEISDLGRGRPIAPDELLGTMLDLEQQGAHNINLVTPTHYSDQLLPLLERARPRLGIPFVWNSNGYEKPATLRRFEGLVTVWLPDLKYSDDSLARRFSSAPDYFRHASSAILEMKRQAGPNRFGPDGTLQRGMIVRHLVLPGQIENTLRVLDWLRAELGPDTLISLMAQYYPTHRAAELPGMDRRLSTAEYAAVRDHFESLGFDEGFIQQLDSASRDYTPDFGAGG